MTKQELVQRMQQGQAWIAGKRVKIDFGRDQGVVMLDGAAQQVTEEDSAADTTIRATLEQAFRGREAREWEAQLLAAGVACVEVAAGPSEATLWEGDDAIGRQMNLIVERRHPVLGDYPRMRSLVDFSRPTTVTPSTPALGEHTEKVRKEFG